MPLLPDRGRGRQAAGFADGASRIFESAEELVHAGKRGMRERKLRVRGERLLERARGTAARREHGIQGVYVRIARGN